MDRWSTRLHLLLVEDSAADADLLQDMLSDELPGCRVTVAPTLAVARAVLDAGCDVVITDLSLPDADGVQAVTAVRAACPDVPLLVLTGLADRERAFTALSAGADDYLVKGLHDARGVSTAVLYAVQRRRFEQDARSLERLAASLLDAMESPTCSVDAEGTVVAVNRAWLEVTERHGGDPARSGVGCDYLEVCRGDARTGGAIADGLQQVLTGERDRFELDYPCAFPDGERWYSLRITPLAGRSGAVLTHVDVTVTKQAQRELLHRSTHDALTGLANRALLEQRLAEALVATGTDAAAVGVAFIDLDRFERVNGSQGHLVGDQLLRDVADRLTALARAGDTVARFAGDEFVVVWPGLTSSDEADELVARCQAAFDEPFTVGEASIVVSASTGLAVGREPESSGRLLLQAGAAMHDAKRHGRGLTRRYTAELRSGDEARMRTETELRAALVTGDFVLHYQPVVDLRSGRVRGVEALVRWAHEDGLRSPDAFIPVAESTGLIVPLGAWVLEEACRQAAEWSAAGLDLEMAVNLSGRQVSDPEILSTIEGALSRHALSPDRLLLEVTESAVMEDADAAEAALEHIVALGVAVAIDDFGTGYSSLLYLKRFTVRALKVDRSFVAGMGSTPEDDAIVASIVGLARAVGASCIAEGVETLEQQTRLSALGCDRAQGYLFSRAVPADELPAALERAEGVLRRPLPAPRAGGTPVDPRVMQRIEELKGAQASTTTIAAALNRERAPHPQGTRWHPLSVEQASEGRLKTVPRRRPAGVGQQSEARHTQDVWAGSGEIAARLGERFAHSLARPGTVLLAVRASVRALVEGELTGRGLDVPALREAGRYLDWDSDELLSMLTIDGHLSARLFRDLVGSVVESSAERGPVLAYGDLAGRLWEDGEVVKAMALEDHFGRLAGRVDGLSVVCAYPEALELDSESVGQLRRLHGQDEQVA